MRRFGDLAPAARLYVSAVVVAGFAAVPLAWVAFPIHRQVLPELIYLAVGTQIAAFMPLRLANRGTQHIVPPLLVAVGLVAPGAGVALVSWVCVFDGRIPGRDVRWWAFVFNRAVLCLSYVIPSVILSEWALHGPAEIPAKAACFALAVVIINYALMAASVVLVSQTRVSTAIVESLGLTAVRSMLLLCFAGGILYALLRAQGGYLLAPAILGFLFAVRSNMSYAQQQSQERLQTLQLAAQALDARDPYTESHSERVAQLALKIGEKLDLGSRELERLRTAASLHDIGKIGIRDHILNKPAPLSADEWEIMKRHPDIGADLIRQHSALAPLAPAVRHHHERWDGTGYPSRLREMQIPLAARIISVADSFDTITSVRSYRASAMTPLEAVENITSLSGKWYDPAIVDALRNVFGLPRLSLAGLPETAIYHPIGVIKLLRLHPKFAVLVAAMTISAVGDPLTVVATLVSIYSATRQPLAVAAVFGIQACATILMSTLVGGVVDRLDRRRLIVTLEVVRAAVLFLTPLLLNRSAWYIFPVVAILAAANALVQPARQAAVPEFVGPREIGPANAVITGLYTLAASVGYPIAAAVIWLLGSTDWLFRVDAGTFLLAGLLILWIRDLGGRRAQVAVSSAFKRAWAIRPARAFLLLTALAVFFISMSYPALLVLAYHLNRGSGPTTYTELQTSLALGVVCGSVLVGRIRNIGSLQTVAIGLGVMGIFSLGVAITPWLWLAAGLLFLASFGNPIFTVGNQTAFLELGDSGNRGSLMVSRFGVGQLFLVLGAAAGGALVGWAGPGPTYGALGVGLLLIAAIALVGRHTQFGYATHDLVPPPMGADHPQARAAG